LLLAVLAHSLNLPRCKRQPKEKEKKTRVRGIFFRLLKTNFGTGKSGEENPSVAWNSKTVSRGSLSLPKKEQTVANL